MKEQLRAALDAARAGLQPALSLVGAHRFWVECAAVAFFGVMAAFSVGYAAISRTATLEARAAELARAEKSLDHWRTDLQRPTAQESLAWRQSDLTLRSLGGDAGGALPVARLVAQRAGEVGITGVRVQLLAEDSMTQIEPVGAGGWVAEPTGAGLSVEFDGDVGDVIGLLGALPPQAALAKLDLSERAGVPHARVVLATRRIAYPE